MTQSDLVARAADLELVEVGWKPAVDTCQKRVPKARSPEALREAKGEGAAQLRGNLKKGEMVTEAERLLKRSDWLLMFFAVMIRRCCTAWKGRGRLRPFLTPIRAK